MENIKLQLGCLVIICYVVFVYLRERYRFEQKKKVTLYGGLLGTAMLTIALDGVTAYTVNHLETVNEVCNMIMHMLFLLGLDCFIFLLFLYMMFQTTGVPKQKKKLLPVVTPFAISVFFVVTNMPSLEYREGTLSNYSMGISAYTCFIMVGIYMLLSFAILFRRWKYIESHKRWSVFTYLFLMGCVTVFQMLQPESLVSSIGVTVIVLGIYLNQENPTVKELNRYHEEMITGFATLVENKDGSTGGHIKRTTAYVKLLAEELRRSGNFSEILTKDYVENLCLAAPMHDVGKISVPDMILQKPGRLTEGEFEVIKQHAEQGGKIIQETFGHLEDKEYTKTAYEVARYHHEKWNGRGYPEGLSGEEIPLCARIMAVADVFDAVSEKRCYREAMPLDACFEIIRKGSGTDFDPMVAQAFLAARDKVEKIHNEINHVIEKKSAA